MTTFVVAGWLAVGAAVLAGCQEKLTSPATCPDLCPGGQLAVVDTVLDAVPGLDSSFVGYVKAGSAQNLLVSTGLPGSEDRTLFRFAVRPSIFVVNGTDTTTYTIDSVALAFTVRGRDTLADGVRAVLYRLPATIDTTATFASVEPQLTDANVIDTVPIANDSINFTVRTVLRGADLARVTIPSGDSGVLAIGMRITSPTPTGLQIGSVAAGTQASFTTYVTLDTIANTQLQHQTLVRNPTFNTFVAQGTPAPDNNLLAVGGEPSARAVIRFNFPAKLRDSVSIVRATLELVPTGPMNGLPNNPTLLVATPLFADLGAKSPLCTVVGALCGGTALGGSTFLELPNGSADTVRLEVPFIVRTWQGSKPVPPALFLIVNPEAGTFMRPVFFSSRSISGAPRIRISYVPLSTSTSTSP